MKNAISLKGKNVVITGASSGIGKATALSLAREGANLVLAARRELLLEELALECEKFGVKAFPYKTDVTRVDEIRNLFEFALNELESIDIWINNAGVNAVGEFTQTPLEVHERVIQTNLLGYIYGAYVVMPYFKNEKKGHLINNISVGAFVPNVFATAYSASQFGLRGFSETLKCELMDLPDIHISDVFPASINTPEFTHEANYVGKELRPTSAIYDPYDVANTIVDLCKSPKDSAVVGNYGRAARVFHALLPRLFGKSMARSMQNYFRDAKVAEKTKGNLFKPVWKGVGTHGGWSVFHPRKLLKR